MDLGGGLRLLKEFAYERPATVADAVALLQGSGARALAGGTDLIPQMREGRRPVERVVDLKRIPALNVIEELPGGGVVIGAAATASAIARHPLIAAHYPAIAASVCLIGSLQVQNRASLGGNVCNAAPSADGVPALICHGALARIAGPGGERETDLQGLFAGPGRTTLEPGEILTAIVLPPPVPRSAAHYLRFTPRREMDIAVAGVGGWVRLEENGTIAEARLALASVGPTPLRAPSAEKMLIGARPSRELVEEAGRLAAGDARPISDTRGTAQFRRTLVSVLTGRVLAACCRALGEEVDAP